VSISVLQNGYVYVCAHVWVQGMGDGQVKGEGSRGSLTKIKESKSEMMTGGYNNVPRT